MPEIHPSQDQSSTAESVARKYFGLTADSDSARQATRRWLIAAPFSAVLVPLLFWLRFGEIGPIGWGTTIFLVVYCLLTAVGLYFLRRPAFHTPVALRNDWLDRIGAFWLVACAFGPFLSWVLISMIPLTIGSWRWVYAAQSFLSIGLPVLTGSALLRYVRGRGAVIMLALLIGVTSLPVWSALPAWLDLWVGPVTRTVETTSTGSQAAEELYLIHTGQSLKQP